jgi:hypothetical protein
MDINTGLSLLHDSQLIGIDLAVNDTKITFKLTDGSISLIHINGIDRLFCKDLLEENIVSKVDIISCDNITNSDAEYFVSMHAVLSDHVSYLKHIKKLSKVMLIVESSYGAELGCVCSNIKISSEIPIKL